VNTRITSGDVTVTLTGDIEAWVRRATVAAGGEVLRVVREEAEQIAASASAAWYTLVNQQTGLSGQIEVAELIDYDLAEITVSVGSTDTRTAGKRNAPVPRLVRTGGPDSQIRVKVTREEYFATPDRLKYRYPYVWRANPKSNPTRTVLMQALVVEPMNEALGASLGELERRVAAAAERA
jgi:hypothetical protein